MRSPRTSPQSMPSGGRMRKVVSAGTIRAGLSPSILQWDSKAVASRHESVTSSVIHATSTAPPATGRQPGSVNCRNRMVTGSFEFFLEGITSRRIPPSMGSNMTLLSWNCVDPSSQRQPRPLRKSGLKSGMDSTLEGIPKSLSREHIVNPSAYATRAKAQRAAPGGGAPLCQQQNMGSASPGVHQTSREGMGRFGAGRTSSQISAPTNSAHAEPGRINGGVFRQPGQDRPGRLHGQRDQKLLQTLRGCSLRNTPLRPYRLFGCFPSANVTKLPVKAGAGVALLLPKKAIHQRLPAPP